MNKVFWSGLEEQFEQQYGKDWRKMFAPGTWGYLETMERAQQVITLFEDLFLFHPGLIQDKELRKEALEIRRGLDKLREKLQKKNL